MCVVDDDDDNNNNNNDNTFLVKICHLWLTFWHLYSFISLSCVCSPQPKRF